MDQIKIGKFIADERKRKGYTQKQLSEKLAISDKTISSLPKYFYNFPYFTGFLAYSLVK